MSKLNDNEISNSTDNYRKSDVIALSREITAENALIEDLFIRDRTGFVTISYGVMDRNRIIQMQLVTLIISNSSSIRDQFGNQISFRNLRIGMIVNARFSSNMTRSKPPHAVAFSVVIVQENSSTLIEEGRVIRVDVNGDFGYILTGVPSNPSRQMRYAVGKTTRISDRRGNQITLRGIRPGHTVRIERESFQTMSIPPQTSAISVQIILR